MDEKELQALYNAMSNKFDVGDYQQFRSRMQTTDDRKRFYDVVSQKGFDIGDYESFETRIGGSKKKGLGSVGAIAGGIIGTLNGSGQKSEKEFDFNSKENFGGIQKALRENQMLPEVVTDRDAQEAALKQISDVGTNIKPDNKDPLGEVLNHTVNYKTPDTKAQLKVFTQKMKLLNEQAFPSTHQAESWLNNHAQQNNGNIDPNNFTASLAKNVIEDKKKVVDAIHNHFSGNIELAAVDYFGSKDDEMGKKIRDMNGNVPDVLKGHLLIDFLNTKGAKEWAQESPQNKEIYDEKKNHILESYPDIRKQMILQKIGQGREDFGYNNPVLNLVGKKSSDAVVNTLVATGQLTETDKKFYEQQIRPTIAISGEIPTPGLVESVLNTTGEAITDVPKSIADLTGLSMLTDNKPERVYDETKKEYTGVNVTFKGKNALAHAVGDLAGIVIPIGGEAKALQGLNLIKDANTATRLMQGLTFYHQLYRQNLKDMPDNDVGAHFAALLQVAVYDRISKVLPKLAKNVTEEVSPTIKSVMEKLSKNEITGAAAAQEVTQSVISKIKNVGVEGGKNAVGLAGQLAVATEINGTIADIFSGKNHAEQNVQNAAKTFETMLLGGTPLSLLAARGINRQATAETYNKMAEHPEETAAHINLLAQTDKEFAKVAPEYLETLKHLTEIHDELSTREDLSPEQKNKLQLLSLSKKLVENKIEKSPDKILNSKDEKDLAAIEIEQKKVLNPEMGNKQFIEEMYKEDLLPKGSMSLLEDEKGKFSEHKVGDYLKFIAQQANGLDENWKPLEGKAPSMDKVPEQVIEAANERWANEIEGANKPKLKSTSVIMPGENKSPDVVPLKKSEAPQPAVSEPSGGIKSPFAEGSTSDIKFKNAVETIHNKPVNPELQKVLDFFNKNVVGVERFDKNALDKLNQYFGSIENPEIAEALKAINEIVGKSTGKLSEVKGILEKTIPHSKEWKDALEIVYKGEGNVQQLNYQLMNKFVDKLQEVSGHTKELQDTYNDYVRFKEKGLIPETKPQTEQTQSEVAKLEAERDAEIEKVSTPDLKMEFVPAKDLVNSKDPVRNKEIHDDIKERYKKLKSILDCLTKTI